MRILFLSQIVPYPPHGGVLQRGYNIVRELSRYNEVHLLAFVHPDVLLNEDSINESRQELGKFCKTITYFDLWPKRSKLHKYAAFLLGVLYPRPFSVLAHRSSKFRKKILETVQRENIELIHFDTIALAQYLDCAKGLPTVVTHHNIESELMARRAAVELRLPIKLYLQREVRKLIAYEKSQSPMFDINFTMSDVDADKLKAMTPGIKTAVVPNGVDTDYYTPVKGQETKAVIYTGGMNMFANNDAVLYFAKEILPLVRQKIPEIVFYAVGQDPSQELLAIAKQDKSIVVTGYVDDVRPYVAKAGVYIVPLRVGGGTRLKVLDALAQGKAIVSTSVGCEGIEVTPGENIVIADTAEEFAGNVVGLLNDDTERDRISNNARQLAIDSYAWAAIGKDMQEHYVKVAGKQ